MSCPSSCYSYSFSEPNPRKGTETVSWFLVAHQIWSESFSEPNPRKGTETLGFFILSLTNPAIGFSEPNPRKGTETMLAPLIGRGKYFVFFRT